MADQKNLKYTPQPGPAEVEGYPCDHQGMFHQSHAYDDAEQVMTRDLHDEKEMTGHQTGGFHKGR